ncbi:MAG: hypothetical protein RLZ44_584, partial [Pseudomonadota bacterium]
ADAKDRSPGDSLEPANLQEPPPESIEAVREFDQMGQMPDPSASIDGDVAGGEVDAPGAGGPGLLVEQWLDALEGDPVYLLRNRFMMEERRRQQPGRTGGSLYEPRPW